MLPHHNRCTLRTAPCCYRDAAIYIYIYYALEPAMSLIHVYIEWHAPHVSVTSIYPFPRAPNIPTHVASIHTAPLHGIYQLVSLITGSEPQRGHCEFQPFVHPPIKSIHTFLVHGRNLESIAPSALPQLKEASRRVLNPRFSQRYKECVSRRRNKKIHGDRAPTSGGSIYVPVSAPLVVLNLPLSRC